MSEPKMTRIQEDAFIAGQQELLAQLYESLMHLRLQQRSPQGPLEHGESGPQYYRGVKAGIEEAISLLRKVEAGVEVRNRKLQFKIAAQGEEPI